MEKVNRRSFFGKLAAALGAMGLVSQTKPSALAGYEGLPKTVTFNLPDDTEKFMAYEYNTWCRRHKVQPKWAYVSDDLFRSFEGRVQTLQRFTNTSVTQRGYRSLMFKGTTALNTGQPGWSIVFSV